jgi:two-component system, chemotaxis family, CheB/CheR fusion protein
MSRGRDPSSDEASPSGRDAVALQGIFDVLRGASGVDFSEYKAGTVQRRLARRLSFNGLGTLPDYAALLREDPGEVRHLYDDILVHVTSFFRDAEVFDALARKALPAILNGKLASRPIRVWVAGCASGEEVYSLAILLLESLGDRPRQIQIIGTDVSPAVIKRARAGFYSEAALASVSRDRRGKHFIRTSAGYQIKETVHELCTFFQHDLAREPPLSHVDLVSCRNVIMYFRRHSQMGLLARLHHALQQPGFLLLGRAEDLAGSDHLFSSVDDRSKIFSRTATPSVMHRAGDRQERSENRQGVRDDAADVSRPPGLARYLDRMLAKRYVPPGVLVDDRLQILEFRGQTGPYLELAPGEPSNDLVTMVRQELRSPLLAAFERAKSEPAPVRIPGVRIQADDTTATCDLVVVALAAIPYRNRRLYLVMFEPESASP